MHSTIRSSMHMHMHTQLTAAACCMILVTITAGCTPAPQQPQADAPKTVHPSKPKKTTKQPAEKTPGNDVLENNTITLTNEEGVDYQCRIKGVFTFKGKEYALLQKLGQNKPTKEITEDGSLVIMLLTERGEEAVFTTIEDDAEFESVSKFAQDELLDEETPAK